MQNINKFTEVYIFVPSITIRRKLPYMESRVKEIDYLKCIFITLMIIFHLVYIGDKYPYAKQIVYTFHMSAFLIISGYLANNRKDARSFLRINPEKPDVPLNKNDAFQKVQKRRVQEKR